jgi:hypothetical protein
MSNDVVYRHLGTHATSLSSGRDVGPGDEVPADELGEEDAYLVDDGVLVPIVEEEEKPKARRAKNVEGGEANGSS